MVGAADRDLAGDQRDHDDRLERRRHRRAVGVADRDRQRVGGVVGPRQLGEREQRLDHPLDLVLGRAAGAADRALDLLGRVGGAADAALAGGEHDHPARLADRERRAGVGAEVQVLHRHRVGRVLVHQRADALVDARPGGRRRRAPASVSITPPSSATRRAAVVGDDAVAGVGHARIDAEDDHVHGRDSARRAGRLPPTRYGLASRYPGSEDPANPKNQIPNTASASPTETIITLSSTPPAGGWAALAAHRAHPASPARAAPRRGA